MYRWAKNRISPAELTSENSIEVQSEFARRMTAGDFISIGGKIWRIVRIEKGADEAPVVVSDGVRTLSVASLILEQMEQAVTVETPPVNPPHVVRIPPIVPPIPSPTPERAPRRAPTGPVQPHTLRYGAAELTETGEDIVRDATEIELQSDRETAGLLDRLFKHNLAYEEYRQRGIVRGRGKQVAQDSILAPLGLRREASVKATDAVVDRVLRVEDEFLHSAGEHGERRRTFGDTPEEMEVKNQIRDLVMEAAENHEMDPGEWKARKDAIFAAANELAGEAKGKGRIYADNLEKLVQKVRQLSLAAGGMENLDIDIEVVVGRMKLGARTEREKNFVDSALEKLERWGKDKGVIGGILGAFRNEIAIAGGAAFAMSAIAARSILSSTAAKLVTFGGTAVVTGWYSWWKEKGRLNSENALHSREMELGGKMHSTETPEEAAQREEDLPRRESELLRKLAETPLIYFRERGKIKDQIAALHKKEGDQTRRLELEKFKLDVMSAKDLTAGAMGFLTETGVDSHGNPTYELRGDVPIGQATDVLTQINARVHLSDDKRKGFISYSGNVEAEDERYNLDVARRSLMKGLRAQYDADTTIDKTEHPDFQSFYDAMLLLRKDQLYGEDSFSREQEKNYAKYRHGKAMKRAGINVAIGGVLGYVGHELWAWHEGTGTTTGGIIQWFKEYFNHTPVAATGAPLIEHIDGGTFITPGNTTLTPDAHGTFTLETADTHKAIAEGVEIDSNGHFSPATLVRLRGMGFTIVEKDGWVDSADPASFTENAWQWLRHHGMEKIHRDVADDNDTPMHFSEELQKWLGADRNELRLEFGGVNGTGLDEHGMIVMTMGHMTRDGSFHSAIHDNAPAEILEQKVRFLFTLNSHSQNSAVDLIADQQGQIHIDPASDIGKTLFHVENGRVIYDGYHVEVGISKGFDTSGVNHFHILATHTGHGVKEGITTIDTGTCEPVALTMVGLPPAAVEAPEIPLPWMWPGTHPRNPLRKLEKNTTPEDETDEEEEEAHQAAA